MRAVRPRAMRSIRASSPARRPGSSRSSSPSRPALYCLTLAWVFSYLPEWPRAAARSSDAAPPRRWWLEVVMIAGQAARGTTSHFNVATPFDAIVFVAMGAIIVAQTFLAVALAVALWRQRFADPALGWALRLGLVDHRARRVHRRPDDAADRGADRRGADDARRCRSPARTPSARPTAARACPSPAGARGTATSACRTSSACTRGRCCRCSCCWRCRRGDDRRRTRLAIAAGDRLRRRVRRAARPGPARAAARAALIAAHLRLPRVAAAAIHATRPI